jgi:MGT family glycosyltransferase
MPGDGHVNPTIAIAEELVRRGHQVVYYLPERFWPRLRGTGAELRGYDSTYGDVPGCPFQVGAESRHVLPQVLDRIRAEGADCVLYDGLCFWARIVAARLGLPAVRLCASFVMSPDSGMFAQSGSAGSPWLTALAKARTDLRDLAVEYDVPVMDPTDLYLHAEPLNIVFSTRPFHPDPETFDDRFVFVGPSLASRPPVGELPFAGLDAGRLLYVAFGTVFTDRAGVFRTCFDALAGTDWQVIVSKGRTLDDTALGPVPSNFVVAPSVPQLEVLARATAFVTHGGMNSVMESLYHGVPMLVIPQMFEQTLVATKVEELGLGLTLMQPEVDVPALRDAVERLAADAAIRGRARVAREEVRQAGGAARPADAIAAFRP